MNRTRDRRRRAPRRRGGIAAIEFVMWLPLMMFLFWMVLASGHIFLINCEVTAEVRQMAWAGRDEPWRRSPEGVTEGPLPALPGVEPQFAEIGRVVRRCFRDNEALPRDWEPRRGLLAAADAKDIPVMIGLFADLDTARGEHTVLAGVWDHRELPFETFAERGRHKRLEPSKKFNYYTQPYEWIDFSPLKQLAMLGAGGLSQEGDAARVAHDDCRRENAQALRQKRQETIRGIEQTKQEISRLQRELDDLRGGENPDEEAIRHIEDQLHGEQRRLACLEESLARLDRARDVHEAMTREARASAGKEP